MNLEHLFDVTGRIVEDEAIAAPERTRLDGPWRTGRPVPAPACAPVDRAQGQAQVEQAMADYLAEENPDHILLVPAPAGFGKTYKAVELCNRYAARGQRIFYAGPRLNFFDTLREEVEKQGGRIEDWYAWQARRGADPATDTEANCLYPQAVNQWTAHGFAAISFCAQACGWDYIQNECPYHAQRERPEPIIYGTHPHVFLGNPLLANERFDILIGDEEPTSAMFNEWRIRASGIVPRDMALDDPLLGLVVALRKLAEHESGDGQAWQGAALLDRLGGPERVRGLCAQWLERWEEIEGTTLGPIVGDPQMPNDELSYNYLPDLCKLLVREAREAEAGRDYLTRVIVHSGSLWLLLRRYPHVNLPRHIIWLDATGHPDFYEQIFGRPVKQVRVNLKRTGSVVQVASRANGKSAFFNGDEPSDKLRQAAQQVNRIVTDQGVSRYAVATYKDAKGVFGAYTDLLTHFGGNRGSNDLVAEGVDLEWLFVVGTPMPSLFDIEKMAKMLWFEQMEPFDTTWSERPHDFVGTDYRYFKSGLWNDERLNLILWMKREAEIIQTAYRARFLTRPTTVCLLTSLPIDELPADEIWTLRDHVFKAPPGTNAHLWNDCRCIAEAYNEMYGIVTINDFCDELGLRRVTARKYVKLLIENGWIPARRIAQRRGAGRKSTGTCRPLREFDWPADIEQGEWAQVVWHADDLARQRDAITAATLRDRLGCTLKEAEGYLQRLVACADYREARAIRGGYYR